MSTKVRGQRGSWFASAGGELLPCVHAHWFKDEWYADPGAHPGHPGHPGHPQWDEFIAAIKASKKVILTADNVDEAGNFERTGYIGIFSVNDVAVSDGILTFKFVERLEDAK